MGLFVFTCVLLVIGAVVLGYGVLKRRLQMDELDLTEFGAVPEDDFDARHRNHRAQERAQERVDGVNSVKFWSKLIGGGLLATGFALFMWSIIVIVPDGHVGVTKAFGQFGDETLQPGFHIKAPWESVTNVDTRVTSFTFSDDTEEAISGPIRAQARGGGNLLIEHTVQLAPDAETADNLLREVGTNWFEKIVLPAIRSCTRDATIELTLEEAYTTERGTVGDNTFTCLADKVESRGVTMIDVLVRDVDPGNAVRTAIDEKQKAEQQLQRATITLEEERVKAQQEAVRAFGISQAEQIVACGGVEEVGADGEPVITPNLTCEDQFSNEYLQWLYINQLSEIDGTVILPPEFDGNLFVQTPQ